ncbi:MAG: AAA family ATPase [Chloroflexales bacterium]|nr:AAA family ATPase [Chloroflexales bacterium]
MNDAPPVPTGVPGLDAVLAGGLDHPSLAVIVGTPGAGKTLLASHMLFHAARQGHKTIVFTTYSEGNEQYIHHLRSLSFFDAALLGDRVQLFTLSSLLNEAEDAPAAAIARTIIATGAKLVLLDGFQNAHPLLSPNHAIRAILAALAVQIRYLDTTILVTIAGDARDPQHHTEMTVADVVLSLNYTLYGRRHQRLIEVLKLRGRAQQSGLHSYQITGDGFSVFPRIESVPTPQRRLATTERAPFQLPELDKLLGGGPNIGTTMLLAGAPGVGKTILGLQWALAEARHDAVSLFLCFSEQPEQLEHKARAFGLDLRGAVERGHMHIIRFAPADLNPDQVAAALLAELEAPAVRRLVIDDVSVLFHELGERTRDYISALNDLTYAASITSLYLMEIPPFEGLRLHLTNMPLASLGDTLVVVQQYEIAGGLRRLLAVLRMRLSFFDRTLRELVLDERGIRILAPEETAMGLLAEGAQQSGGVAPPGTRADAEAG